MSAADAARAHRICAYIRRRERALELARAAAELGRAAGGESMKVRAVQAAKQANAALVAALRFSPESYRVSFRVLKEARALEARMLRRAHACEYAELRCSTVRRAWEFHRIVLDLVRGLRAA